MVGKILVYDDDDKEFFVDFYFDESSILGYYLTDENHIEGSVNLITTGGSITLKLNEELKSFLLDKGWNR